MNFKIPPSRYSFRSTFGIHGCGIRKSRQLVAPPSIRIIAAPAWLSPSFSLRFLIWETRKHEWASFALPDVHVRLARSATVRPAQNSSAPSIVLITPTGAAGRRRGAVGPGRVGSRQALRRLSRAAAAFRVQSCRSSLLPLAVFAVFSLRHEVKLRLGPAHCGRGAPTCVGGGAHDRRGRKTQQALGVGNSRRVDAHHCYHAADLWGGACTIWCLGCQAVGYGKHIEAGPGRLGAI